ncbi:MAG: hypothetical protein IT223_01100 [Crocinitomicaceae bacterium]|nr:hypothetical protein [Crocinitomicaceae bacterium]
MIRTLKINYAVIILFVTSLILPSCTSFRASQKSFHFDKSQCDEQIVKNYSEADMPKPFNHIAIDTLLTNRFTDKSLRISNAIGLIGVLSDYITLSKEYQSAPTLEKRIGLIELLQQINEKISTASLEVSAISSKLDCEEKRAQQFANYLKEKEGEAEKKLIIGSIIIGSAGAISAEAISNTSSNNHLSSGLTVSVSIVEATLGILMLVNKRKIEFYHLDNALTDIWKNSSVSSYYPPAIWYYLTTENPQSKEKSLAKLLVEKWYLFDQVSKGEKEDKSDLYFGKGGKYMADELMNRADMLDQTESYVALMKQDLKMLAQEISKLHQKY